MAYSDFDLREVRRAFQLDIEERENLFAAVSPIVVPALLGDALAKWVPVALSTNTEKARSEMIIAPILMAAVELSEAPLGLFSGVTLDVDGERGLTGVCDYLLSSSDDLYFPSSPLVAIVEAKKENIPSGLGQCLAEMIAAQEFNLREGQPLPAIYGTVTTGNNWRFLKLSGQNVWIDFAEYALPDLGKILAILLSMTEAK
jgi:hypothetical protein